MSLGREFLARIYPISMLALCITIIWHVDKTLVQIIALYFAVIFGFDVDSRYKEYVTIANSDQSCRFVHERRLKRMRFSKCQRNAAIAGSIDQDHARKFYKSLGYKWYHLIPDETFTKKSPLLRPSSWEQTLGID